MIFVTLGLLLIMTGSLYATPYLSITNYDTPYILNKQPLLLYYEGDHPDFKNPDFDDRDWETLSPPAVLPMKSNTGVVWYRFHFRLPDYLPSKAFAILIGKIYDTDKTYLNGELIGVNGLLNQSNSTYVRDLKRLYEMPNVLLKTNADNVLAIRSQLVYREFGIGSDIMEINYFIDLYNGIIKQDMLKIVFVSVYLVISILYLLFFLRRTKDRFYLYFGLFSFFTCLYFFLLTQIKFVLGIDYDFMKQMEYFSLFLLFPLLQLFLIDYFHQKHHVIHYLFYIASAFSAISVLIINDPVYRNVMNLHFVQYTWIIPIFTIIKILLQEFKKNIDARLIFGSFVMVMLFVFYDILAARFDTLHSQTGFVTTYAFIIFEVGMAIILANRFVRLHLAINDLNQSLKESLEEIKQNNEQLSVLDQMKSDLMANVSHELRTPITNIYGAMELMVSGDVDLGNLEESYGFIKSTFQEIKGLKKIINNFILLSLNEKTGKYLMEIKPLLFFREFVNKFIFREFSDTIIQKKLSITYPLLEHLDDSMVIRTDKEYFTHLFYELFHNAITYNKIGGRVVIDGSLTENSLTITIEDTGFGIKEENLTRIFERFYRVDSYDNYSISGIGLGLSVVQTIAEKLNFKIAVESVPDVGTKFIINNITYYRKGG